MTPLLPPEGWYSLPAGPENSITDVPGVAVGQVTVNRGQTISGVTAVLPHGGDLYRDPVPAGAAILNGFGKSLGLVQLMELGEISTPILLSNTFAVPVCANALIRAACAANPRIGNALPTVNPLVLECNDGGVNCIEGLGLTEDDANAALAAALPQPPQQGTVGAGQGMRSFGLSGGIGTASRRVEGWTLGTLVLSNFGKAGELRVFGQRILPATPATPAEKGSIIILYATDAPLDARQLTRIARRAAAGLGRLGSYLGHGSGDIAVAFSTARPGQGQALLPDDRLDPFFLAAVETLEQAVLNALWHARPMPTRDGQAGRVLAEIYQSPSSSPA